MNHARVSSRSAAWRAAREVLLMVVAAIVVGCGGDPARPGKFARRLEEAGLPRFGEVSPMLLRGGQPTAEGLRHLAERGVRIVVNLRRETFPDALEQAIVESLGMRYVAIPMHGLRTPTNDEIAAFLAVICESPGERVFVHCRRGAERAGVAVAAARIALEGWNADDAVSELDVFDFRGLLFPHYARYVRRFPQTLIAAPSFAALRESHCLAPRP